MSLGEVTDISKFLRLGLSNFVQKNLPREREYFFGPFGRKSGSCRAAKLGCFTRWVEFVFFLIPQI